jgi:hypothetical protein
MNERDAALIRTVRLSMVHRRQPTPLMETCPHCLNPMPTTEAQFDALDRSADSAPCECLEAACGHLLCDEMDDEPSCEGCVRCEACCACTCEHCG